ASKLAAAQAPVLAKAQGYLSAAAEAVQTEANAAPKAGTRLRIANLPQAIANAVARLAMERSLDPNFLGQWTAAVLSGVNDEHDLLHPLAIAALSEKTAGGTAEASDSHAALPLPRRGGEGRGEGEQAVGEHPTF